MLFVLFKMLLQIEGQFIILSFNLTYSVSVMSAVFVLFKAISLACSLEFIAYIRFHMGHYKTCF